MGLTTEEVKEVAYVLYEAYSIAIETVNSDIKKKAIEMTAGLVHNEKPYRLFSQEGSERLSIIAFDDGELFDYFQTLSIQFFARWGAAKERYERLAATAAFAIGSEGVGAGESSMPKQLADRLPRTDTLTEVFMDNRWCLILALIMLYLRIEDTVKPLGSNTFPKNTVTS